MQGEQLRATIYEFRPDNNTPIALTKRSLHHMRSVTTNTSAPHATAFSAALLQRCVSGLEGAEVLGFVCTCLALPGDS